MSPLRNFSFYIKLKVKHKNKIFPPQTFVKIMAAYWNPEAQLKNKEPIFFRESIITHSQNYNKIWSILLPKWSLKGLEHSILSVNATFFQKNHSPFKPRVCSWKSRPSS